MKRVFFSITFAITALMIPLSGAEATYPGKSIAYWDFAISEEQNEPVYRKIEAQVQESHFDEALRLLDEKITASPRESTPRILKAFVLNEKGEYNEAMKFLRQGEKIEVRHPAIPFAFCQLYRNLGVSDLSRRACHIAVDQHPNAPEAHYELAQTLMAMGNMPLANAELLLASELAPENPVYPYERGMNFNYLNRPDEAEKAFLKALAIKPNDIDTAYQLAYLYAIGGKPDKAKAYAMKALEAQQEHPTQESARRLLKYIGSNTVDQLPTKIIPQNYHVGRSRLLYQAGKVGPAIIEIQTAAELSPDDLKINEVLIGVTSILMRLELTENAVLHLLELAKGDNAIEAKAYQELGDIRLLEGKISDAREYYQKALALGDPNEIAKISLKELPEDAFPPLSFNRDHLFFKPAEALNRKGEIFAYYNMYQRALALYSMVIRMDPQNLMSPLNSATAQYHLKNYSRAISILERLLIAHPNHEYILPHRMLLAQAYVQNGNLTDSLKHLRYIVNADPGLKNKIKSDPVFEPLKAINDFNELVK